MQLEADDSSSLCPQNQNSRSESIFEAHDTQKPPNMLLEHSFVCQKVDNGPLSDFQQRGGALVIYTSVLIIINQCFIISMWLVQGVLVCVYVYIYNR